MTHLHVALRLHEAAHDAEYGVQLLVARFLTQRRRRRRDDGVERPLPRRQAVGVRRVQDEVGAAVLQQEHCRIRAEDEGRVMSGVRL